MSASPTVIVSTARTPMGRLLGGASRLSGAELGAVAIRGALDRAGVAPETVDQVLMGQVLTAGAGQLPARQAAIDAGIPLSVPATTISKVCLSGIQAIILADMMLRTGDATRVIAGGQESMTRAPHLQEARRGTKYGAIEMADHMALDGLTDALTGEPMGLLTEQANDRFSISRAEQDAFAARSHQLAAAAWDAGFFTDEVVPVHGPRGEVLLERDESIRPDSTAESLGGLRASFRDGGTITAGNASPISDGASALLLMSRDAAEAAGLSWIAEIGAHGMVAGPDTSLQEQPAHAIEAACAREGITPADLDLVEINEAFAAVGIASANRLGIPLEKINVNGGAIALGHPLGMSGARIVAHLALELRRRGGGIGAAALCGGGGQGDALIVRVPKA
ncbi:MULTISPECIES: acetyl-CoA C-acyltransferase [unclassified Leucobacter]|uniref:acetyl-CoA C-acyltransferase n=1 Tax=unclassified Leucobacter TaxID=2621730 RepID=UPI00165E1E75|nr:MULTISPECIES: acetyl-CoA C-acyltransferase [unclassified Leucobacter]MBC9928611.1 acetyl-CoA C-acyltransferase [Leucobacter sp. cx-169]